MKAANLTIGTKVQAYFPNGIVEKVTVEKISVDSYYATITFDNGKKVLANLDYEYDVVRG